MEESFIAVLDRKDTGNSQYSISSQSVDIEIETKWIKVGRKIHF